MDGLVYASVHEYPIEDENGDLVDVVVCCSDYCHRDVAGDNYGGWFGCQEIEHDTSHGPLVCEVCGATIWEPGE